MPGGVSRCASGLHGRARWKPARVGLGVDEFVGNYTSRLDAKGRVSIPAPFRAVLARDGYEGLYVHPSLDADNVMDCGGNALRHKIHDLLGHFSPYSDEYTMFSTVLLGTSENLKIDTEGRVILSESTKAHAKITTEVTFVGLGFRFQIWEPGRFFAQLPEATRKLRDYKKLLSSRPVAPEMPPPRQHGARE